MRTVQATSGAYAARRAWIAEYFDRTAAVAWAQLTSDAPVNRVRRTVREGRDRMRATLLDWLPADLTDMRLLDAGCGTGALAVAAAARGAQVVAIDLSPTLVDLARSRAPAALQGQIDFRAGDMLEDAPGTFDYTVAMDSVIHYRTPEMLAVLGGMAARTRHAVLFTVAPRTPLLAAMHTVGRVFPRGSRAPAIEPVRERELRDGAWPLARDGWQLARTARVASGFYTSQAWQLSRETHQEAAS